VIVNLEKAPRNKRGRVEYWSSLYILKPVDMERGNKKIFVDPTNRGGKQILASLNDAPGAQFSGRDNVIGFIAVFQEAFPDLRLEIEQLLTDGPAAAAEGALAGTHDGVLHTPNGDVAPTGRALALRWAAVYVTDGDTLKSEHLFFDQMDFLGQLGLLPG